MSEQRWRAGEPFYLDPLLSAVEKLRGSAKYVYDEGRWFDVVARLTDAELSALGYHLKDLKKRYHINPKRQKNPYKGKHAALLGAAQVHADMKKGKHMLGGYTKEDMVSYIFDQYPKGLIAINGKPATVAALQRLRVDDLKKILRHLPFSMTRAYKKAKK